MAFRILFLLSMLIPANAHGDPSLLLPGDRLALTASVSNTAKKAMKVVVRDSMIDLGGGNLSVDDPTIGGGGAQLFSAAFTAYYNMPPDGWSYLGEAGDNRGYRYRAYLTGDPIKRAIVKPGILKVVGRGPLEHLLFDNPDPVDVLFALASQFHCMRFGGEVTFEPSQKYVATGAPAPAACP